ncbi:MAG: hypothetical protein FD149_846 [Rhodospirillaceae bacterium]|nr:MAG: hypothetical protein FD149_846 [Rhodospirillaceae bacterium]
MVPVFFKMCLWGKTRMASLYAKRIRTFLTVGLVMVGGMGVPVWAQGIPVTDTNLLGADFGPPAAYDHDNAGHNNAGLSLAGGDESLPYGAYYGSYGSNGDETNSLAEPFSGSRNDPAYVLMGGGAFDFHRNATAEVDFAYRSGEKYLGLFKPHFGILAGTDGNVYGWWGVLVDVYFGNRFVLTPSTAVGVYARGGGKPLGHVVEFRSGLDAGYRFDDRSRLAVGIYHMSNAGLGRRNPGEESLILHYDIPVRALFSRGK